MIIKMLKCSGVALLTMSALFGGGYLVLEFGINTSVAKNYSIPRNQVARPTNNQHPIIGNLSTGIAPCYPHIKLEDVVRKSTVQNELQQYFGPIQ